MAGEYLGLNYHRQFGVDFVAMRVVRAYGPGYRYPGAAPNDGARMIKDMIEGALSSDRVRVEHPPITVSEWVYAKDLAQGMTLACFATDLTDRVFNLGSGRLRHCDEVIAIIRGLLSRRDVRARGTRRETAAPKQLDAAGRPYAFKKAIGVRAGFHAGGRLVGLRGRNAPRTKKRTAANLVEEETP